MSVCADSPLRGRVAVITGAGRRAGIGFAVARRLLALGADVFVQSWTPHDTRRPWGADPLGIDGVIALLRGEGGRVQHVEADFADPAAPAAVLDRARGAFGHVDILVVNHARRGWARSPSSRPQRSTPSCTRMSALRCFWSRSTPLSTTAAAVAVSSS